MHIVIFTEEPSSEAALLNILPRIIDNTLHTTQILPHCGKQDLLRKLPSKLRGMQGMVSYGWRFMVLIDQDKDDCHILKQELERIAQNAGLRTISSPSADGQFQVVNRIVIEELESWFMGDPQAVCMAYPRVNNRIFQQQRFANPDAIRGGTCEALERILRRAGYFRAGLAKREAARSISQYMDVTVNRSHSFNCFIRGIQAFNIHDYL